MGFQKIELLPRSVFKALSQVEQDDYLQSLARAQQSGDNRSAVPLSPEALGRLRRFYRRRTFADLKREVISDTGLAGRLAKLTDAVNGTTLRKMVALEIASNEPKRRINRLPPVDDAQIEFFQPVIHDVPLKDEWDMMDVAAFSLSKSTRETTIRYQLNGCVITVAGGADVGIANAYDYDVFLHMVTCLADEMRRYKQEERKGLMPSLPPPVFRTSAAQILKFCRRANGGKQYEELERSLKRLQATRIMIVSLDGSKRREGGFQLINQYEILSRTMKGRIGTLQIDIPRWVYEGVVNPTRHDSLVTLNPDYFLIKKPTGKFLYRLARRAANKGTAHYSVKDVHARSGSTVPLRRFELAMQKFVQDSKEDPLPDYDLEFIQSRNGPILRFERREELLETGELFLSQASA